MDAAVLRIAEAVCEAGDLIAAIEAGVDSERRRGELVADLRRLAARTWDEDAAAAACGAAAELQRTLRARPAQRSARAA